MSGLCSSLSNIGSELADAHSKIVRALRPLDDRLCAGLGTPLRASRLRNEQKSPNAMTGILRHDRLQDVAFEFARRISQAERDLNYRLFVRKVVVDREPIRPADPLLGEVRSKGRDTPRPQFAHEARRRLIAGARALDDKEGWQFHDEIIRDLEQSLALHCRIPIGRISAFETPNRLYGNVLL